MTRIFDILFSFFVLLLLNPLLLVLITSGYFDTGSPIFRQERVGKGKKPFRSMTRPNLFNQEELINERDSRGIYSFRPGITGLAQINKIDMSTPKLLAETDSKMLKELITLGYFKYIFLTVFGKGFGDRINAKFYS